MAGAGLAANQLLNWLGQLVPLVFILMASAVSAMIDRTACNF
jgi:hypothetical protein